MSRQSRRVFIIFYSYLKKIENVTRLDLNVLLPMEKLYRASRPLGVPQPESNLPLFERYYPKLSITQF